MRSRTRRGGTANLQAIAFAIAAGAGAAVIIALKSLELDQLYVTLGPVVVMCGYAALIIRPYFRARADQLGDNLYYLGFINTLISLSLSLVDFSSGGDADAIVSNFGIALATTLLGIVFRVMFNQMRTDPVETEREARLQLAEASRRLKIELSNATTEFSMATRSNRQAVSDAMHELRDELRKILEQASESLSAAVDGSANSLATASAGLTSEVDSASATIANANSRLKESIDAASNQWTETSSATISRNSEFNGAARRLVTAVERLTAKLDEGLAPTEAVGAQLTNLSAEALALETAIRGAKEQLGQSVITLATMASAADQAHRRALETARISIEQSRKVNEAADAFSRATTVVDSAAELPGNVSAALEDMDHRLSGSASRAMAELAENLRPVLAGAEADRASLAALVHKLDALVAELQRLSAIPKPDDHDLRAAE